MIVFAFVILFLGLGITVEGARIWSAWRNVAAQADAAAAAGASGIDEPAFRSSNGQTIQLDPATAEERPGRSPRWFHKSTGLPFSDQGRPHVATPAQASQKSSASKSDVPFTTETTDSTRRSAIGVGTEMRGG